MPRFRSTSVEPAQPLTHQKRTTQKFDRTLEMLGYGTRERQSMPRQDRADGPNAHASTAIGVASRDVAPADRANFR